MLRFSLSETEHWVIDRLVTAIQLFAVARPPGIYKQDYLNELVIRYGEDEEELVVPDFPDWGTVFVECFGMRRIFAFVGMADGTHEIFSANLLELDD